MVCQVVNSQSQVQSRLPTLPQQLPQTQQDWNALLATLNQWGSILQQANHAPNVIPSQFQTFTTPAAAAVIAALSATNCTPSVDNSQQFYGGASLKTVIGATGAVLAFAGFPISIAGASRWFCSFQILAPSGCTASLTVATSASNSVTESFTVPASGAWQQVWGLFDLRQWPDTQARWIFTFTSTATVWLDGMQMNAVGAPIGVLPKFAGTQMVTGALAYASNLDGVPDGSTYGRTLGSGLTSGVVNTNGLVANAATAVYETTVAGPVNVFTSGTTPTQIASLSVPSVPYATTIVVTVVGVVDHHAPSAQFSTYAEVTTFTISTASFGQENQIARNGSTAVPDAGGAFAFEQTFSVPANTAETFYLYGAAGGLSVPGAYANIYSVNMKAEVIKR